MTVHRMVCETRCISPFAVARAKGGGFGKPAGVSPVLDHHAAAAAVRWFSELPDALFCSTLQNRPAPRPGLNAESSVSLLIVLAPER